MAFQPAAINAIESLVAPRVGATNGGDFSGLFQLLVAGAATPAGETPMTGLPAVVSPTNSSGAFALLLQTGEAPAQTSTTESAQPALTLQTAFAPEAADLAPSASVAADTASLTEEPGAPIIVAQTQPTTETTSTKPQKNAVASTAPVANAPDEAAPIVTTETPQPTKLAETDAAALTLLAAIPDDQAPPQPVAATPDAAQAIVFAPFVANTAQPVVKAAASKTGGDAINADQPDTAPKGDVFKKFVFNAAPAKDNAGGAGNANAPGVRVSADAQASPQAIQAQRPDSSLPGSASPISGFEAPRATADAISTPVARAPHGAAAMQVAQHISRNFQGSSSNFEVRLDPAELGRVDVKISVDHDKRVTASVSADNPQTLTDLRGAARDIERALNEAGLDLAQGGLSFEMNQHQANDDEFDASAYGAGKDETASNETIAIAAKPFGMERWSNAGVDVWA